MTPSAAFVRRAVAQRKALGLSQAAIARHLSDMGFAGWCQQVVAKVESGKRTLKFDEAVALSDLLGLPLVESHAPSLVGAELARLRAENSQLQARISGAINVLTALIEENR